MPAALGLPPTFFARDLLGGERYRWTIGRNFVRLDPGQSHVFKLERMSDALASHGIRGRLQATRRLRHAASTS